MLDNNIVLNPTSYGGANVAKTYNLVSLPGDGNRSIRRVAATATTAPDLLTVSHRVTVKGGVTTDEHMVRIDQQLTDPVVGSAPISAWFVLRAPRGTTVVTEQLIKDAMGRVQAFLQTSGYTLAFINGEP